VYDSPIHGRRVTAFDGRDVIVACVDNHEGMMPSSKLLQLAEAHAYEPFEAACFEALEAGQLRLAELVAPFERFERAGQAERLATLAQVIFENTDPAADPQAGLQLARMALNAAPQNDVLRRIAADLYRRVYTSTAGLDALLQSSGLETGRPVRAALNVLDLCLTLQPGDVLVNRMDGRVVEITEIDRANALFTLRRTDRVIAMPAADVSREYERLAPDDFRVLRNLRPDQLAALIHDDPVRVVIGLIRAHGGHLDADLLKHELVPKYIEAKEWSAWWTRARNQLKRSPHVIVEGRSPMLLRYTAEGQTLEDEAWAALSAQKEPAQWQSTIEAYLREKAARKEPPDQPLLTRCHDFLCEEVAAATGRRPRDALACALVIETLAGKGLPATDDSRALAGRILRDAAEPDALLLGLPQEGLQERAWAALRSARPDDWARWAAALLPRVPAGVLDRLARDLVKAGQATTVQSFVDAGLGDLANRPELAYWLWKGPKEAGALRLPGDGDLFRLVLDTLSALGRTVSADAGVVKEYRHRVRTALAIKDFARVRRCLAESSEAAAVTIRRQLQRLEGVGPTVQSRLLEILREAHPQLFLVKPDQVEPWSDPDTVWTTSAGLRQRTAERDELVNVKMHENAKRIGEAASHGDLSENSEYRFALEERDLLRARVAALNDDLSRARVLEPHDVPSDHVGIGTRVTLRRLDDGTVRVMTFLGPFDTDVEHGIYSYQAPVAQRLMGARVGEQRIVGLDGRDAAVEVVDVTSAVTRKND
jgi:transcription elongation GreA/GreB family factor